MKPSAAPPTRFLPETGRVVLALLGILLSISGGLWAAPVPDILISMSTAPGAAPEYAIIVEKSTQTLSVYRYDGAFQKIAGYPCSTGKANGDKWVSGDMKTPEGVYFFTDHHNDGELAPIYGTRAYPLNYPNVIDRQEGKDGFAIWLHGTDRPLVPYDSNGCVAMNNADIDNLAAFIDLERTPILLAETLHYVDSEGASALRARLLDFVETWGQRLTSGSYHQYLALYDPDYLPPIDWWRDWQDFRRTAASIGDVAILLDSVSLYRHQGTLVSAFRQTLQVGPHQRPAGWRTLYIREVDGGMRIVGDDYHRIDADRADDDGAIPLISATRWFKQSDGAQARLAAFVEQWLAAWSAQDIAAYGDCYAETFMSKKMTKRQWLDYKKSLNETYSSIQVSAKDISYRVAGDTAVVTFTQRYASNRYRSEGRKTLHLRMEKHQWKIFREIYSGT
ncbi:MAG: L,D-transpeptidase family protein [Pseudomonadota bacterium]